MLYASSYKTRTDGAEMHRGLWWGDLKKERHGRLRFWLKNIWKTDLKGVGFQGADWFHMARDRVKWWAVINAIINRCVPYGAVSFDSHRKTSLTSQEEMCSLEIFGLPTSNQPFRNWLVSSSVTALIYVATQLNVFCYCVNFINCFVFTLTYLQYQYSVRSSSSSALIGVSHWISSFDVWLTVHRNSVWIRKTN